MLNLLSNAVKFCDPGRGVIEIGLAEHRGSLRVDVRDNGAGISPQDQAVIFDKFRQGGDVGGRAQGTGLGLHICRHIIEHHGGRLWVESRPGAGACFSFTLPAEHAAMQQAEDANQL
jgi:signal transduction histidine kinase